MAIGIVGVVPAAAGTGASHGATLYAAPHGRNSGSCSHPHPCTLDRVFSVAKTNDTVIVRSGTYGSPTSPVTKLVINDSDRLTIRGETDKPAPLLYTGDTARIDASEGSTVSDLRIVHFGSSPAVYIGPDSEADHLDVTANGEGTEACEMFGGRLSESVCFATGAGSYGLEAALDSDSQTMELDGVDAIDSASDGVGLYARAWYGSTLQLNVLDSIAEASSADVEVSVGGSGDQAQVSFDYSDFVTSQFDDSSGGLALIALTPNDVDTRAKLKDPFGGDFREKPSSPTVDAGTSDLAGSTDVSGHQRTAGSATDIGAFEYLPPPVLSAVHFARRRGALRATVKVNASRVKTAVKLVAVRGGHAVSSRVKLTRSGTAKRVTLALNGLARHAKYHVYVRAASKGGHAVTRTVVLKTR